METKPLLNLGDLRLVELGQSAGWLHLLAPPSFWQLTHVQCTQYCNGCGSREGVDVPDTFYGLNMTECCNIHDWMYQIGKTKEDRLFADMIFLQNLLMHIEVKSNRFMQYLRSYRAVTYWKVVRQHGESAFSQAKSPCTFH